jgi:hypothetical protein
MKHQIVGIISLIFVTCLPFPVQAGLIVSADYEGGSFGFAETCSGSTCPSGFPSMGFVASRTIVSSPVRGGSRAVRVDYSATDFNAGCFLYAAFRTQCNRAEFELHDVHPVGSERWYGFSIYVDPSWTDTSTDPNGTIVTQFHDVGACDVTIGPFLSLNITNNMNWRVRQQSDATECSTDPAVGRIDFDLGAVTTGVWVDWVIHAVWRIDNTGQLRIWKNGTVVVDQVNHINRYNNPAGINNIKWGVYKSWWTVIAPPTGDKMRIYFDNYKIGDASSSYDEIAPKNSEPTTPLAPSNLQVKVP